MKSKVNWQVNTVLLQSAAFGMRWNDWVGLAGMVAAAVQLSRPSIATAQQKLPAQNKKLEIAQPKERWGVELKSTSLTATR